MDDELVALAGSAGIHAVVEGGLRDEREGVGLPLGHGWFVGRISPVGPIGSVGRVGRGRFRGNALGMSPLIQRVACRVERPHEQGAHLRAEPATDDDHPVFIVIHVQGAHGVPAGGLAGFRVAVDPAPAPDDALDVLGGAGLADGEQARLGLGVATRVNARTVAYESSP